MTVMSVSRSFLSPARPRSALPSAGSFPERVRGRVLPQRLGARRQHRQCLRPGGDSRAHRGAASHRGGDPDWNLCASSRRPPRRFGNPLFGGNMPPAPAHHAGLLQIMRRWHAGREITVRTSQRGRRPLNRRADRVVRHRPRMSYGERASLTCRPAAELTPQNGPMSRFRSSRDAKYRGPDKVRPALRHRCAAGHAYAPILARRSRRAPT
jgi:hypothetical protein